MPAARLALHALLLSLLATGCRRGPDAPAPSPNGGAMSSTAGPPRTAPTRREKVAGDKEKAPGSPSDEVIVAWQKAGCTYGYKYRGSQSWWFGAGHAPPGALPAFSSRDTGALAKLPDPEMPFPLNLESSVRDADLEGIKGLTSLASLTFSTGYG